MQDEYTTEDPLTRYAKIASLAEEFFETTQWKKKMAARYGITPQAIAKWSNQGAPVWAFIAIEDATLAKRADKAIKDRREADAALQLSYTPRRGPEG